MKESQKTGIFAAIAAVALIAALATQPRRSADEGSGVKALINKKLFPEFEDPLAAASMSIVKFDESLGTLDEFEVRKDSQTGQWTIPSHAGYPADATTQMRDAATLFVGMDILGIASERREDHAEFGVVEPDVNRLKVGDQGVGLLVKVKDGKDKDLASLIVGKEDAGQPGQRFVRIPAQDVIYVVKISTEPLVTDFRKWIEKDLLQLSSFDISELGIKDYSIVRTQDGAAMQKIYEADVDFDTNASKWNLKKWIAYEGAKGTEKQIPEGEEVNGNRLNDVKNALDQLEIVDVDRKPAGLSADLKADKNLLEANNADVLSLYERGFFPQPTPDGGSEILSSSGELLVTLNDGIQYVLRFGNLFGDQSGASSENALNRRMMLTVRFDESKFPPPELQVLPETVEDLLKLDQASQPPPFSTEPAAPAPTEPPAAPAEAPAASGETPPAAATPAEPSAPAATEEAPKADSPAPEAKGDGAAPVGEGDNPNAGTDSKKSTRLVAFQPPADQPPADEAKQEEPKSEAKPADAAPADAAAQTEEKKPDEPKAETPAEDAKPQEGQAPAAEMKEEAPKQETPEELKERLELTREQITKENQRKIDERNDRIAKAKKKVQELNARFADWYYVISEDVYKKLRVTQAELVGKPQPAAPQGGVPQGLPPGLNLPFGPGGN